MRDQDFPHRQGLDLRITPTRRVIWYLHEDASELFVLNVILRNEATKNPFPEWAVRILRYAQNDMKM